MEATVEVLTAEVRTLMVGSRQVTLSVYKQLDEVSYEEIQPFGRVRSGKAFGDEIELVGSHFETGVLVRATVPAAGPLLELVSFMLPSGYQVKALADRSWRVSDGGHVVAERKTNGEWQFRFHEETIREAITKADAMMKDEQAVVDRFADLPLIVLAGLR